MIPPRALNGGLFTGQPFLEGAPWANVPVIPDVDYMTNVNLVSAGPPPGAIYQYPGNTRPGNNSQANTGLEKCGPHNFACVTCDTIKRTPVCRCQKNAFISGNDFNKCTCVDKVFVPV